MKKIDWVRKLTSRKLWTAVASFVSMMILATGGTDNTATQVTALIMSVRGGIHHWRRLDRFSQHRLKQRGRGVI